MRASFEEISSKKGDASFVAYGLQVPTFPFKWHYHPEYELTLITRGSGKRLVGDSHELFAAGDLVLIGPDLPHTWVSDKRPRGGSGAVVIQFSEAFTEGFLSWPECAAIGTLLRESARGLSFPAKRTRAVAEAIEALPSLGALDRITALLSILQRLTAIKPKALSSPFFQSARSRDTEQRINKVCRFIGRQATGPVRLADVAAMAHLSPSAFCRFFRRVMGTTFSDYLNDIRIGHACSLLSGSDKTVAETAFAAGFESLTYFNRVFLKKKGLSPRSYRIRMEALEGGTV